ncbi:hypothetical protein [Mycolicibacterium sphagni]|uniref:hypothetical protein n=1 Tax=Mycolicibacterium sphagni TaxID=1786 RepID=UPI0021F38E3E|nr:hypothetical protein [Mycolicibacterium sphagni]MCV7174915.1 hypothetical protein [Mycolicibacterium sphagni]
MNPLDFPVGDCIFQSHHDGDDHWFTIDCADPHILIGNAFLDDIREAPSSPDQVVLIGPLRDDRGADQFPEAAAGSFPDGHGVAGHQCQPNVWGNICYTGSTIRFKPRGQDEVLYLIQEIDESNSFAPAWHAVLPD